MSECERGHDERIAELERQLQAEDERLERILAASTTAELLRATEEPGAPRGTAAQPAFRAGFVVVALVLGALVLLVWLATLAAAPAPPPAVAPAPVVPPPPMPQPSPVTRRNATVAAAIPSLNGQPQVFLMPARGGHARRLNPDPTRNMAISTEWRPDGKALAVATGNRLLELGVSMSGPLRGQPVWRKRRPIASMPLVRATYSPDGSRLGFVTSDGNVWTSNPQTQALAQLTHDGGFDGSVDWSPSGRAIAATRGGRLLVLVDGSARRSIPFSRDATWPRWSPSGRAISFSGFGEDGYMHVFLTDPFGDRVRQLPIGPAPSAEADWSPDGRQLVYAKLIGDEWDLFVCDLRTYRERRLTATKLDESGPAWSPDGRWIAFVRNAT